MGKKLVLSILILSCLFWTVLLFLSGCTNASRRASDINSAGKAVEFQRDNDQIVKLDIGVAPENMVVADFDNDGIMDLATSSHGASCVKIFKGLGKRKFKLVEELSKDIVGHHPRVIKAVDWDGDGLKDIICAAEGISSLLWLRNNGKFGFVNMAEFALESPPRAMDIADMDGDGNLDVVLGPYDTGSIKVLWGRGPGKFEFAISSIKAHRIVLHITIADWNSDGRQDILWSETHSYKVRVALNQGKRRFETRNIFERPKDYIELPRSLAAADLNGDGCLDVVVPLEIGGAALITYGNCKGGVLDTERIKAPSYGFRGVGAVAAGKGHPAMIALGETNRYFIGTRAHDQSWKLKEFPVKGIPEEFEFMDIDMDGNLDLFFIIRTRDTGEILFGPILSK